MSRRFDRGRQDGMVGRSPGRSPAPKRELIKGRFVDVPERAVSQLLASVTPAPYTPRVPCRHPCQLGGLITPQMSVPSPGI